MASTGSSSSSKGLLWRMPRSRSCGLEESPAGECRQVVDRAARACAPPIWRCRAPSADLPRRLRIPLLEGGFDEREDGAKSIPRPMVCRSSCAPCARGIRPAASSAPSPANTTLHPASWTASDSSHNEPALIVDHRAVCRPGLRQGKHRPGRPAVRNRPADSRRRPAREFAGFRFFVVTARQSRRPR